MGYSGPAQQGYPVGPGGYYPGAMPMPTNGLAIASLVCGIIGGCVCLVWIPAIIMGVIALDQIKATGDRQPGKGMAIAGIALGAVWAALVVVWLLRVFV